MLNEEIARCVELTKSVNNVSDTSIIDLLQSHSSLTSFDGARQEFQQSCAEDGCRFNDLSTPTWIAAMYRTAMIDEALELGNRWIRHIAPTLVGRLDALLTEAFGETDEIAGSLKSVCAAALGREVRLNQRKRKGDFSVIVKAIRRLLKDGLLIHWANVASSSLALKDLFGLQAVFEPEPDCYSQNRLIPESEVGRLREAEARLRALTTLSILDAKAFAESPGLLATSRIHATLSGATPIEIQLWIKGYLLPMRSHWYARHKGFSHAPALERTAAEERVRRFRQLEISGAHEEAQEALFQELAFGHR